MPYCSCLPLHHKNAPCGAFLYCGGEGIRTLDTLSDIHTFQACRFNHSRTPPCKGGKNTIFPEITPINWFPTGRIAIQSNKTGN